MPHSHETKPPKLDEDREYQLRHLGFHYACISDSATSWERLHDILSCIGETLARDACRGFEASREVAEIGDCFSLIYSLLHVFNVRCDCELFEAAGAALFGFSPDGRLLYPEREISQQFVHGALDRRQ